MDASERPSSSRQRPLELAHGSLRHSLSIPANLHEAASRRRDAFLATLPAPALEQASTAEHENHPVLTAVLVAQFMAYLANDAEPSRLLTLVLDDFERVWCRGNDIHAFVATLPDVETHRQVLLRSYYAARAAIHASVRPRDPALWRAAQCDEARVYAIFGGQGDIKGYFDELRDVQATYEPLVADLISSSSRLLSALSQDQRVAKEYPKGLDVRQWLRDPASTPSVDYLIAAPVSMPLIGLLQLAYYRVTCQALGKTPAEVSRHLRGMTGHSQGIVVAAALAAADSWDSFDQLARSALTILFWIGARSQQVYPPVSLAQRTIQESIDNAEGDPSPMLAISNLPQSQVRTHIEAINAHLPVNKHISVSLINGALNTVVSGPSSSLCALNVRLRDIKAPAGLDQTRIPFTQRKTRFTSRFLPISAPFHSSYLQDAVPLIEEDLNDVHIDSDSLRVPVYATDTGEDLKQRAQGDLVPALVRMVTTDRVDWPAASKFSGATHVLDFGPSGLSGIGVLTQRDKDGSGVRVIVVGCLNGSNADVGYRPELFDRDEHAVRYAVNWLKRFGPRLRKTPQGNTIVDTKLSRLLEAPPIMVAGMTPCTVAWDFVAATMNAGYHIELAGGGYFDARSMTEALNKIERAIPAGRGITINLIYINPRAMQWQIPLISQLRANGFPIDGLTIGAGVPSIDVASEYINTLGLKHIAFKPGSEESIQQVIKIAKANPTFPIILQWTGGRGGGHHSFEDFHQPILQLYGAVRKHENIILVAGSGFGGAEDTYEYLAGTWSTRFGHAPMPFDGCLLGSRVMTARETHTSQDAKRAIVEARGVGDAEWEKTYNGPAGGVITVLSEMGEPIHKLATRGVLFWAEMDQTIFSLEKGKRAAALAKNRAHIIKKLNDDFQKVWFGRDSAGEAVDLEDMTYAEVLCRLVELTFIQDQSRWIDPSYRTLVGDYIRRFEERLVTSDGQTSYLRDYSDLDDPHPTIDRILSVYPNADQLLSAEDARYFLHLCRRRGQKPVPFVPVLDNDFEFWFKKDSLWQSEDLDAVVGRDIGRTCILQGPMAVKYATTADEPIKEILDNIHNGHVSLLTRDLHGSGAVVSEEGCSDRGTQDPLANLNLDGLMMASSYEKATYHIASSSEAVLPLTDAWFTLLAGPADSWRRALLLSDLILHGRKVQPNPIRRIFAAVKGLTVEITHPDDPANTVLSAYQESSNAGALTHLVDVKLNAQSEIEVHLFVQSSAVKGAPLALTLKYMRISQPGCPAIQEVMEGRNDRIKAFYYRLWFGDESEPPVNVPITAEFNGGRTTISRQSISDFVRAVGITGEDYTARPGKELFAPMDFGIVVAWKAMFKPLFSNGLDGDLLKLVHLSNEFRMFPHATPLKENDEVEVTSRVDAVMIQDSGKMVQVCGVISREGKPVMEVSSQFLYRGTYTDFETTFQQKAETPMQVELSTPRQVALLQSKPWFHLSESDVDLLGHTLTFRLTSRTYFKSKTTYSFVETVGPVLLELPTKQSVQVGTVEYRAGFSHGNPVVDYLQRCGVAVDQPASLESTISLTGKSPLVMTAPESNEPYAVASGDFNPIHVSSVFSDFVELPGTITHGMYSSAAARNLVDVSVAENDIGRMRRFKASFVGMVLPKDEIEIHVQHTSMLAGRKVVKIEAVKRQGGEKVLTGEAEIEPPFTTYIFTGQGSQQPKMGMELYVSSPVARAIWDKADQYFEENYGFLISDIVKHNPKELKIHFGGPRGNCIRENYMAMVYEKYLTEDTVQSIRIFKEIDETTTSYTHRSPNGLLFATQFAQPALTIMELASFEDMKAKELISPDSAFAGHSLGEYAALAAIANIMPLERLLSTVFYRGLTMQLAVERDEASRSNFGMVAVDPSRISPAFSPAMLQTLVQTIAQHTQWLLEIVNHNIEGKQYVCAGDLRALDCLTQAANQLHAAPLPPQPTTTSPTTTDFLPLITHHATLTRAKPLPLTLARGKATIPLSGVDVPFHSSFLLPSMKAFRNLLLQNIHPDTLDATKLLGKYVPNLTARPFEVSKDYFESVRQLTGSQRLEAILDDWHVYEAIEEADLPGSIPVR